MGVKPPQINNLGSFSNLAQLDFFFRYFTSFILLGIHIGYERSSVLTERVGAGRFRPVLPRQCGHKLAYPWID